MRARLILEGSIVVTTSGFGLTSTSVASTEKLYELFLQPHSSATVPNVSCVRFEARLQNYEKGQLASSCLSLSVHPSVSVRM